MKAQQLTIMYLHKTQLATLSSMPQTSGQTMQQKGILKGLSGLTRTDKVHSRMHVLASIPSAGVLRVGFKGAQGISTLLVHD
jgi:hypothetical protein